MNTYTLNEIAEQEAHKAMLKTILGANTYEVGPIERMNLYEVLKGNEEIAVKEELYHLAEVYNYAAKGVAA